jgi:DNA-binding NtrC family response regulator
MKYLKKNEKNMAMNILIIDEEQRNRDFLQTLLEKRGYKVTVLEDAYRVEGILRKETFNIIFLDINTVGIRNTGLLSHIKRQCPNSYIILITSKRGDEFIKDAMDFGAYGCVCKPFNVDEILTLTKYLIPGKKSK